MKRKPGNLQVNRKGVVWIVVVGRWSLAVLWYCFATLWLPHVDMDRAWEVIRVRCEAMDPETRSSYILSSIGHMLEVFSISSHAGGVILSVLMFSVLYAQRSAVS
jgi:hypothetical protein